MYEQVKGGVCAPKGFKATGVNCGIRNNKIKKDLAIIISDVPAAAAAVYTTNLVKGAPIYVTKENIADGIAQAMVCNSGNANTCNADGHSIATGMCALVEAQFGIKAQDVIVASTGVIGQPLSLEPIRRGMPLLKDGLSDSGSLDAALAIMTTDTRVKEIAVTFKAGGKTCVMGGIAKGSGMIHPNMATMLVFITTDAAISSALLRKALSDDVKDTFNMVSVDGDTSTNDMASVMANGMAGNPVIETESADYMAFCGALKTVTTTLCRAIAKDGEGATKLLTANVSGAKDTAAAKTVAKSVICSSLFKAAMFGADANWGRVLCAIGYAGAEVDVKKVDVGFSSKAGSIVVCKNGAGVAFDEDTAKSILTADEIDVNIALNEGTHTATAWGCDLTYDYVKINGDYRS